MTEASPTEPGRLELPAVFRPLFTPARYKVFYGGRGSAKSWTFAGALVHIASRTKVRVLCAREIQGSIADSVHRLLQDEIFRLGYTDLFDVTANSIRSHTGSDFLFKGLRHNVNEIKSTEGINICWVEEGQRVSSDSWEILIPTIRQAASEIWVSFNPENEFDPTFERFVTRPPDDCIVRKVSWRDNPWFPKELDNERRYLQRVDPAAYAHVWEGECRSLSDAQILSGKYVIEPFVPDATWDGPYLGADWGFSQDPTTGVKAWVHDNRLWVEHEVYKIGCELDHTAALFDLIPGFRGGTTIRADSARPETISFLNRHGYPNVVAAEKGPGSVEDGIAFLRSFEQIIIHPRCKHTANEARMYRYKTDRLTDAVTTDIVDADNHCIDALRYALEPLCKSRNMGIFNYYREEAARAAQETASANARR
jgi:phage terminase large subunit